MFVFNTTYTVHESVDAAWLKYAKTVLIPDMTDDGFLMPMLMKIECMVEPGYNSYALQFCFDNREFIARWQESLYSEYASAIRSTFGEKVLFFSTIMERI